MDIWASGDAYEPYVGRWSRLVAREFVPWLGLSAGRRWLDVECGTGALTQIIFELAVPSEVKGIDPTEGYVAYARQTLQSNTVSFEVGDAQQLPFENARFDAVVSGLVINFLPQAERGITEMTRVARPGGIVAGYVWDYSGQMNSCAISGTRQ